MCSSSFYTKFVLKSRFDADKYPNDAVQFFYGDVEPYTVEEEVDLSDLPFARAPLFGALIANDLLPVEPLNAPNMQLYYTDYTYPATIDVEIEEPNPLNPYRYVAKKHTATNNKLRKKVKNANYNIFQRRR